MRKHEILINRSLEVKAYSPLVLVEIVTKLPDDVIPVIETPARDFPSAASVIVPVIRCWANDKAGTSKSK